jgi:hypothetical protein
MLETIREYALERLEQSGAATVRRAHADYYLALAQAAELELRRSRQRLWQERLEHEFDNLRAVLADAETETALQLCLALWRFWYTHPVVDEGQRWLAATLEGGKVVPPALRAKALNLAGRLAGLEDHTLRATTYLEAGLALTSLTALWALEDTAQLKRGETILIHGGAGGVASFAIQLAKHIGATVITTASRANHEYVRKLGADRVIDYQTEDFTKVADPCDVVFDTVGGEVQVRSYDVLKPDGRLVWIAAAPASFQPSRSDVKVLRPRVDRDRAHLERMVELLEAGAVWPPAITRYKLADAAEAHRVSEGRHLQGKLVLEVR